MIRSRSHSPSRRKGEPPKRKLARCTLVGLALFVSQMFALEKAESQVIHKSIHYKQYAFIQLNHSFTEFYCLDELYHKESRWNPKAKNGSHYGIPQGRSKYLAKVNGYKQIDWGLKYIKARHYTPCKALDHFKRKGWH
jgi:hypothetical protein